MLFKQDELLALLLKRREFGLRIPTHDAVYLDREIDPLRFGPSAYGTCQE